MTSDLALTRMPQKGPMLLIAEVLASDETTLRALARDHRGEDYPLRIAGRLAVPTLVEVGAQAAAAHASLHSIGGAHAGLLLALHGVEILEDDADAVEEPLEVTVERLYFDDNGARYRFEILDGACVLLRGEATLKMQAT